MKHVADVIRRNTRESDWLARWGGDEFVLMLRDTEGRASAEAALERITRHLDENPVRLPRGDEIRLTFSGGVSQYADGDDAQKIFAKADTALYHAIKDERDKKIAYETDLTTRS